MRWVTSKADSEGNVNFSPGPTTFVKDAVTTTVTEDTATPANNIPLPAGMYFYKDGVATPVRSDSVTPSNTAPLPVELYGAGTTINLTAGDINVQLSSEGATFDSTRIGDGSGVYLNVNADGSINAVTGGLTDAQLRASAIAVSGPLTDTQLRATAVPVSGPLTDAQIRASALPVSAASLPLPTGAATSAKQDDLISKLPSTIGQKAAADSLSVVLASGTALSVSSTTLATEAKQDVQIAELQQIEADVEAVALKLPSSIGQKTAADSLSVVFASGTSVSATITGGATEAKQDTQITLLGNIDTAIDAMSAKVNQIDASAIYNAQITVGITAIRATVAGTAPNAARKKLFIKSSADNTGRIYLGSSGVTIANGLEIIGPDRLEFDLDASDYYVISDTAGQKVEILEKY